MTVVNGSIPPQRNMINAIRKHEHLYTRYIQRVQRTIPRFNSSTLEHVQQWLESSQNETAMLTDLDEDITVMFLQLGPKSSFSQHLNSEQQTALLASSEAAPLSLNHVEALFPAKPGSKARHHTLVFYQAYWKLGQPFEETDTHAGLVVDIVRHQVVRGLCNASLTSADVPLRCIKLSGLKARPQLQGAQWQLTQPLDVAFVLERDPAKLLLSELVAHVNAQCTAEELEQFQKATSHFTAGGFKSLLQKLVRYKPKVLCLDANTRLPLASAVHVSFFCLALHPGSFVPDIQRYVTGLESATKRAAIIVFEDAAVPVDSTSKDVLLAMMASAFVAQRIKPSFWTPSADSLVAWANLLVACCQDSRYYQYSIAQASDLRPYSLQSGVDVLQNVSALLDAVGGMRSDSLLVRQIASANTAETGQDIQPDEMALSHCFDQHWTPEVVHYMPLDNVQSLLTFDSKPFAATFAQLFRQVSGLNPRKEDVSIISPFRIAATQGQHLAWMHRCGTMLSRPSLEEEYMCSYTVPLGWLAGLVGALELKIKHEKQTMTVLVTLLPDNPTEMVVVRRPTRDLKDGSVPEAVQVEAKAQIQTRLATEGLPLNSCNSPVPWLRKARLFITSEAEIEVVLEDGTRRAWCDVQDSTLLVPTHSSLPLDLEMAVQQRGQGVAEGDLHIQVNVLLAASGLAVLRRTYVLLSMNAATITLPRVSRDGGSTAEAVTAHDPAAWQLLLRLSVLMPGALRPRPHHPLELEIPHSPLLWELRNLVVEHLQTRRARSPRVHTEAGWPILKETRQRQLYTYQHEAVQEMLERLRQGFSTQFLWMTVGMGKTLVVMSYLAHLQAQQMLPPYVIYTLPRSALKSVHDEISAFNGPVAMIVPTKTVRKDHPLASLVKHGAGRPQFSRFQINLIEHDHLRLVTDQLSSIADEAVFVVDEVHKALNDTLRTAAALEMARLAEGTIVLTGTPVVDNKTYKLIRWLSQLVAFEVNEKNFWVAANGMVAKRVVTNIEVAMTESIAPWTAEEEAVHHELVPPKLDGSNVNASPSDIRQAMLLCYDIATRHMLTEIKRLLVHGGVFVVARDAAHAGALESGCARLVGRGGVYVLSRGQALHLDDAAVVAGTVPDYKVVIAPLAAAEGYTLTRLKSMVRGVYPSNNATREQLMGRINRVSQAAKRIEICTVHCGILSFVYRHHQDAASLSKVLQELATVVDRS
jgi:hypothetical protein